MCKKGDQCPGPGCPDGDGTGVGDMDEEAPTHGADRQLLDAALAHDAQQDEWGADADEPVDDGWNQMVPWDPTAQRGAQEDEDAESPDLEIVTPINVYSPAPPPSSASKRPVSPTDDFDSKVPEPRQWDHLPDDEALARRLQEQEWAAARQQSLRRQRPRFEGSGKQEASEDFKEDPADQDPPPPSSSSSSSWMRRRPRSPDTDADHKVPAHVAQDEQMALELQAQEDRQAARDRNWRKKPKPASAAASADDDVEVDAPAPEHKEPDLGGQPPARGVVPLTIITFNVNHFSDNTSADRGALKHPDRIEDRIQAIEQEYEEDVAALTSWRDSALAPYDDRKDREAERERKRIFGEFAAQKTALQNAKNDAIAPLKKALKTLAIEALLSNNRPDILVLQEVNSLDAGELQAIAARAGDHYRVSMGPLLRTVGNRNVTKDAAQVEYYPILYDARRVEIEDEFALVVHEDPAAQAQVRRSDRQRQLASSSSAPPELDRSKPFQVLPNSEFTGRPLGWITHRPVIGQVIRASARDANGQELSATFVLGTVHTSPSADVERSSVQYVSAARAHFVDQARERLVRSPIAGPVDQKERDRLPPRERLHPDVPILLAGDWYAKSQEFQDALSRNDFDLHRSVGNTNFPGHGAGMRADFFVGRGAELGNVRAAEPIVRGAPRAALIESGWTHASDHRAVIAEVALRPNVEGRPRLSRSRSMPGLFVHAQDGHRIGQHHRRHSCSATSSQPGNQTNGRQPTGKRTGGKQRKKH